MTRLPEDVTGRLDRHYHSPIYLFGITRFFQESPWEGKLFQTVEAAHQWWQEVHPGSVLTERWQAQRNPLEDPEWHFAFSDHAQPVAPVVLQQMAEWCHVSPDTLTAMTLGEVYEKHVLEPIQQRIRAGNATRQTCVQAKADQLKVSPASTPTEPTKNVKVQYVQDSLFEVVL